MYKKVTRTQIHADKAVLETRMTDAKQIVMGIDPGLAKTGIAFLQREASGIPKLLYAGVIETKPTPKKQRNTLRVTTDDSRRYKELYQVIDSLCREYKPFAVGIEAYLIGQQAASSAWKTAVVYGGIMFYAYANKLYVAPFLPTDLKRRFVGRQSGSKLDVAHGIYPLIEGAEEMIDELPKTKREHAIDAAGHAFLIFEEVDKTREMLGI